MEDLSLKEKYILERLVSENILITRKRMQMLHCFCEHREITDVVEVYFELRKKYGISYATVYGFLRILVRIGLVIREEKGLKYIYRLSDN